MRRTFVVLSYKTPLLRQRILNDEGISSKSRISTIITVSEMGVIDNWSTIYIIESL